jgi:hypothetical protein
VAPLVDGDPVVAAAGDIARAPPATRTASGCHHRETSDLLVAGASGYFGYLGSAATPRQPSCRSACAGAYSYDLGTWHIVVLNTECGKPGVGGCSRTSPQGRWLAADLAAHPNQCTLAYWHRPWWKDNGGTNGNSASFVQALYDAGAEVVLVGHEHLYERFAPQTPSGVADPNGIRQFIVGTGGKSRHGLSGTPPRNSQVRYAGGFGVLALTLRPASYDWRFVSEAGRTFTDAGSHPCR